MPIVRTVRGLALMHGDNVAHLSLLSAILMDKTTGAGQAKKVICQRVNHWPAMALTRLTPYSRESMASYELEALVANHQRRREYPAKAMMSTARTVWTASTANNGT